MTAAGVLVAIAAVYLVWLLLLYTAQGRMVFPGTVLAETPAPKGVEVWRRPVAEGEVEALFWRVEADAEPRPLVVFAHGNLELADDAQALADRYNALGWHFLAPEYRGYGRSGGSPSKAHIAQDFVFFVRKALARPDVAEDKLVYHGLSLGGGVVSEVADRLPPSAVIFQSTFTSADRFAHSLGAPAFVLKHRFDNLSFARTFEGKMLVLHGRTDDQIPFEQGQRLAEAAGVAVVGLQCGHNDCEVVEAERIREVIAAFLRELDSGN